MFKNFFHGRYGVDNLSLALLVAGTLFLSFRSLWIVGMAMLGYSIFRAFSRDTNKRYQELRKFNAAFKGIKPFLDRFMMGINDAFKLVKRKFNNYKMRYEQRKDFAFVKCPKCSSTLRLPKKIGKLKVTCPVCKIEFIKKT